MQKPHPNQARVLVVDDHRLSRCFMAAASRESGCSVKEATDIGEAVEAALAWLPHVVLTDWNLPGGKGSQLLRRIREGWPADRPFPRAVLLSGEPRGGIPVQSARRFDRVLYKPCSASQLAAAILQRPGAEIHDRPSVDGAFFSRFRSELGLRIPDLSRLLLAGKTRDAGNTAHQLAGSAAFCGEKRLEQSLRAFGAACRSAPDTTLLANRWCELSNAARDFRAGVKRAR